MGRARRVELFCALGAIVVAGCISGLTRPLPPLEHELESAGWTRGAEFVLLTLVIWMLLSAVGLIRARIGLGLDGITAERMLQANDDRREDVDGLRRDLRDIHEAITRLTAVLECRDVVAAASSDPGVPNRPEGPRLSIDGETGGPSV